MAAIENLKQASDMFGPALNKHLPIVLTLVKKRQDLASRDRIYDLKVTLIANGGEDAKAIVDMMELK